MGGKAIYFDSTMVPNDIEALKNFYRKNGFYKAKISAAYVLDHDDLTAHLTFNIQEGIPIILKKISVTGINLIAPEFQETIKKNTEIDSQTIYRDAIVESKRDFIVNFLKDHGHMLAQADRPKVEIDTMKNTADVRINIIPLERYRISNIIVSKTGPGMEDVTDDLLIELVGIKKESWYSYSDTQRGLVRLYRTNLFNGTNIYGVIADTAGIHVPISISADIGMMNELSPEIIANNEDNTFNLGIALNYYRKNFLGEARKFTTSTSIAVQNIGEFLKKTSFTDSTFYGYVDARVSLEQPLLFGQSINTKLEAYATRKKERDNYNSTLYGAKLSLDFELPENVYLSYFNSFINIEQSEYEFQEAYLIRNLKAAYIRAEVNALTADSLANANVKGPIYSNGTTEILGFSFGASKTNDPIYPNSGYSLSFVVEESNSIAALFSKLIKSDFNRPQSFKLVATTTFFPEIFSSRESVFGMKLKIGNIFTYQGNKADIPLNQRLYSGGSNSVRGWSTRKLVPKQQLLPSKDFSPQDLDDIIKGSELGGFFLLEGSIETRQKFMGNFGAALFVDFGNTWNGINEFKINDIAVAAGVGFRFYSDYVPFRIDVGLKIYDPNDTRSIFKKTFFGEIWQIHFGIGEAF